MWTVRNIQGENPVGTKNVTNETERFANKVTLKAAVIGVECMFLHKKTSLLRRLQAQTIPDATPPIGKIHPLSKMDVTFEPLHCVKNH